MTAKRAVIAGIVIVLVVIGLSSFFSYESRTKLCNGNRTLAKIERTLLKSQSAQSKELIKKGATFGLTKEELDEAIEKGTIIQGQFLNELDALANTNCSIL